MQRRKQKHTVLSGLKDADNSGVSGLLSKTYLVFGHQLLQRLCCHAPRCTVLPLLLLRLLQLLLFLLQSLLPLNTDFVE
jgi:hypothetical protein